MTLQDRISDEQLEQVFEGTNYAGKNKRDIVKYALLKCACGHANGGTTKKILLALGLVNKKQILTQDGKQYLHECFKEIL